MCVFMLRSRMKTEGGSEVEAAIEKAFPAIAEGQPLERRDERIEARGADFTMPPTQVTGSTIAMRG